MCLAVFFTAALAARGDTRDEAVVQEVPRDADALVIDTVMARVFTYGARHGKKADSFTSEIYVRHTLETRRRNALMRYVPGMYRLEKGTHSYFGEMLSRYLYSPPEDLYKKDIAAYHTMPHWRPSRDRWLGRYHLSIYNANLFTDRILSPLHRRNARYYRYRTRYCYMDRGRRIFSIAVQPRLSNTQLVRGHIDVDGESGRVVRFDFNFYYDWARLHVSGEMGRSGMAALLPQRLLITSRLTLFGNHIDETFEGLAVYRAASGSRNPKAGRRGRSRYDLTRQHLLRSDTTRMVHGTDYFDLHRPYPLLSHQQDILRNYHSRNDSTPAIADTLSTPSAALTDTTALRRLQQMPDSLAGGDATTPAADSTPKARRRFFSSQTEDLILDSHTFGNTDKSFVKLPAILTPSMVQWSRSRGFTLQTRLRGNVRLSRRRYLTMSPRVGYNFRQHQVYWNLPLHLDLRPSRGMYLSIEAGGGDHAYNSRQADAVRQQLHGVTHYDSVVKVFDAQDFNYYRDNRLITTFTVEPRVGLQLHLGLRYHRRALLHWNEVAAADGLRAHLASLAPRFHVVWTPALYYYRQEGRAVPLRSSWPTFMLDYERGLRLAHHHTNYERMEVDAQYVLPLYALRSLYLRAGGGLYTHRGINSFIDYDNFRYDYLPTGRHDELSGQFQLLDSRLYNESRYYIRLCAAYESPMLLFSRLRFLTRMVEKERLYLNLLQADYGGLYGEVGYGISTPLIDVTGFIARPRSSGFRIGCKVALSFFKD